MKYELGVSLGYRRQGRNQERQYGFITAPQSRVNLYTGYPIARNPIRPIHRGLGTLGEASACARGFVQFVGKQRQLAEIDRSQEYERKDSGTRQLYGKNP